MSGITNAGRRKLKESLPNLDKPGPWWERRLPIEE
jgi:hypothetical protein